MKIDFRDSANFSQAALIRHEATDRYLLRNWYDTRNHDTALLLTALNRLSPLWQELNKGGHTIMPPKEPQAAHLAAGNSKGVYPLLPLDSSLRSASLHSAHRPAADMKNEAWYRYSAIADVIPKWVSRPLSLCLFFEKWYRNRLYKKYSESKRLFSFGRAGKM